MVTDVSTSPVFGFTVVSEGTGRGRGGQTRGPVKSRKCNIGFGESTQDLVVFWIKEGTG